MGLTIEKLEAVERRYTELEGLLCDPVTLSDPSNVRKLSKERSDLEELVQRVREFRELDKQIRENRELVSDPELGELAASELPGQMARFAEIEQQITRLLLPADPHDARNTILEIRGGTGGEEAALFAGDLFRMYSRFAERNNWKIEMMSINDSGAGGLKEAIALISGKQVYSRLKHESGVHRVQRVPATESSGRIHTSTATVAVLPEADDVQIEVNEKDLRVDTFCATGPGGQGVNTTYSAIRITHLPTGTVVQCQDERSQHKNKARALKVLRSRLLDLEMQKQRDAIAQSRRSQVGTGERAEKIRTYNFPQNRVTDHRVNVTVHRLPDLMDGDLDPLVGPIAAHFQAEALKEEVKV